MAARGIAGIPSIALDPRSSKLECAILSALVHDHGRCEESLWNWFLVLESAFPWLEDPNEVRIELRTLWADGIIELEKPAMGSYTGDAEHDTKFFLVNPFTATLTAKGVTRWDTIRRWPVSSD